MGALSWMPIPRGAQIIVLAGLLLVYALATGLNPPVVRSALMALVGLVAYKFRRESDPLSALALGAVLYLLWRPNAIYDIGFQLSFLTVGALILFLPPQREAPATAREFALRHSGDAIRLSWAAFVASAPLVAYHFGTVALLSLPANLLVAAVVPVLIVGGLVAHLASFLSMPLGVGLLQILDPLAGWVLWSVDSLGQPKWAVAEVPGFWAGWLPLVYGLGLMTWRQRIVQP